MNLLAGALTFLIIGDSHSVGPFGKHLDELLRTTPTTQVSTQAVCGSTSAWWYNEKPTTCGYFFRNVDGVIERNRVIREAKPTPEILPLLETVKPNVTIVELGTNYGPAVIDDRPDATIISEMRKMAQDIRASGSACVWVGIPDTVKYRDQEKHIFDLTVKAVGDLCTVIDSLEITRYPNAPESCRDGLHYSCKEGIPVAKRWAEQVYLKVVSTQN